MEGFDRSRQFVLIIFVFALIALTYSNTLHSPLNFDDTLVIQTEIAQSGEQYYQPYPPRYRHLFYLSLTLNHAQGQLDPFGYHIVNIGLHFLTTVVIFFISFITIQRGTEWGQYATPISIITTLAFALSPAHSETVTYISGRTVGLSGLFYFSTLLFFILGSFRDRATGTRVFCYLFSVLLFVAAVLSKETSLTLPAIILLYDFCFMSNEKWSPRKTRFLYFYLPLLAGGVFSIFKVLSMTSMIVEWWHKIDFDYALQQSRIVGRGIYLLLFPIGLTFDTDFPDAFFPPPALRAWPLLLLAVFLAGVIKYFPKLTKLVCFGILWFLVTIAPTNSFLPRMDLLSERNLYIPSFGIFFLLASVGVPFFLSQSSRLRKLGVFGLATILTFHTALLVDRNFTYRSNTVLWEDVVHKSPGKSRAWNNLSHFYLMELNFDKAYDSLQGLIKSNPSRKVLASAHSKLGVIHSRQGRLKEAGASYEEGIRQDPSVPVNHLNLGGVYVRQGQFVKAKEAYAKAEELFISNPSYKNVPASLYLSQGHTLYLLKSFDQAEVAIKKYLGMVPESKFGHSLLGNIYSVTGKTAEAASEYAKADKVAK